MSDRPCPTCHGTGTIPSPRPSDDLRPRQYCDGVCLNWQIGGTCGKGHPLAFQMPERWQPPNTNDWGQYRQGYLRRTCPDKLPLAE